MITAKQKLILRELVDFRCQMCNRHEHEVGTLEIHRIVRGNAGGKYTPNNLLIICNEHHKELHGSEF